MNKFSAVILAAGEGSRMKSRLPKVLHSVADKSLLEHVVNAVVPLQPEAIYVIFGKDRPEVRDSLAHLPVTWVQQDEQLGTAHAVEQALPQIPDDHRVLILYGDVPLIQRSTLEGLVETADDHIAWLSAEFSDPSGLGRIVREKDQPKKIVEEKDTNDAQKQIKEINTGISLVPAALLKAWLPQIENKNAQKEFYLTDTFAMAIEKKVPLQIVKTDSANEVRGINNRMQLAKAERIYQMTAAEKLMQQGVTLRDPKRFDLRGELEVGQDVEIDVNVIIEGKVTLGNQVKIGPNVILRDAIIHDGAAIKANTLIEESEVGERCQVGPFARLRPGTVLKDDAKIGNFVEIKKSTIGKKSKVNHLTYIGDTDMGENVNIGAGTITCNYDGANKHQTTIEDDVHIGSNNNLVAPVTIAKGATTGSGSTISKDAPAGELTISRAKQITVKGWKRPVKKT